MRLINELGFAFKPKVRKTLKVLKGREEAFGNLWKFFSICVGVLTPEIVRE